VSLFEAINPLVSSFKNAFLILHRPLLSVLLEQCLTRFSVKRGGMRKYGEVLRSRATRRARSSPSTPTAAASTSGSPPRRRGPSAPKPPQASGSLADFLAANDQMLPPAPAFLPPPKRRRLDANPLTVAQADVDTVEVAALDEWIQEHVEVHCHPEDEDGSEGGGSRNHLIAVQKSCRLWPLPTPSTSPGYSWAWFVSFRLSPPHTGSPVAPAPAPIT